jgi:hypothetical protein
MLSGDDSLKSSEAAQVSDIKTKRLFVTGKGSYCLNTFSLFV